ncbi:MAG: riboflavin synthase, partial [Opitutales bacterium]
DLLEETIQSTAFAHLKPGARINLERSLAVGGRMGGHFLSGHVDEAAKVTLFEQRGENYYLLVEAASKSARYLAPKGSVAIDGVSLTVCEVDGSSFSVWLIPHTMGVTTLGGLEPGDLVNLEFDLLAKYVESIIAGRAEK